MLVEPDGTVLTEIVSILYALEQEHGPARSSAETRRLHEWLCMISTDLHQTVLGPVFDPSAPPDAQRDARERMLPSPLAHLERHLQTRPTLLGGPPSAADAYLVWALLLLRTLDREQVATPGLSGFRRSMRAHAWVSGAVRVEQQTLDERGSPT